MAAHNPLDNQMVGARCWANTNADVDLPFRGDIQVGDYEDLLLLIMQGIERA